ncbi:MAG: GGDEF domain-containing protein [Gemmatimonadaceae bacterium]
MNSLLRIKALQQDLAQRERQLADMNDRLRQMSQTDALTALDNRRYIEERLVEMFGHATRFNEPLACMMCDLDRFKSVNDTHGHQAGDAVLRQLADILRHEAREIDRIGRYGGEEFIFLLPGTSAAAAMIFAERVRAAVDAHEFVFPGGSVRRSMSCGVAAWPHPGVDSSDALVKAADDALYVAKETGRNRVVRYDGPEFRVHRS